MEKSKLASKIFNILSKVDVLDSTSLESPSAKIREIIESAEMPKELQSDIIEAYRELGKKTRKK
ncbi:MAG: PEP/pyruvate-binding domain-containing protein [Candidatus Methanomethyliaceae archaeon]